MTRRSQSRRPSSTRWAERTYRILLLLYPRPFRREFGPTMVEVFRTQWETRTARLGARAWPRMILGTVRDALTTASRQRLTTAFGAGTLRKLREVTDLGGVLEDIRFGTRSLRRSPGYTVASLLTLAVGLGATTAIFSVVNSVLFRPLPYPDAQQLAAVWRTNDRTSAGAVSYLDLRDWRSFNESFVEMGGYFGVTGRFAGEHGAEQLTGEAVTFGVLPLLGVRPYLGRWFTEDEDRLGGPSAIILSYRVWRERYGSDSAIVSRAIVVDDEPTTVVGVMPPGFAFPTREAAYWVPCREDEILREGGMESPGRDVNFLNVIGRLEPGTDIAAASRELKALAARIDAEEPQGRERGVRLESLHKVIVGDVHIMLFTFLGAVAMVLAIACANVANLSLVRAVSRQREIAVRTAIGAQRWRLVRQMLTESLLLACLGAALGVLLAVGATEVLAAVGGSLIPRGDEIRLDGTALLFTAGIALLSGVSFGLFPALQAAGDGPAATLKDETRSNTSGRGAQKFRQTLVVGQVALALMLLAGGGLLVNSFLRLSAVDPGFDADNALTAWVDLPPDEYTGHDDAVLAFFDELRSRLKGMPGVVAAAYSYSLPFTDNNFRQAYVVEGQEGEASGDGPWARTVIVGEGYFEATRVPMLRGRAFDSGDRGGPPVAIVNHTMANQAWPGQDPIGKRFRIGGAVSGNVGSLDRRFFSRDWMTVVGVAADVRSDSLAEAAVAEFYRPHSQMAWTGMSLFVRTTAAPERLVGAVRNEVWAIDAGVAVTGMSTMRDLLARSVATPRFRTLVLTLFALAAGLLAIIGVYGVMAYVVAQRTQEIGVRLALGATRHVVQRHILARGLALAGLGVLLGLVGASAAARVLSSMVFGISPRDPATYAAAAIALTLVASLASYLPARRAGRVDPAVALRQE